MMNGRPTSWIVARDLGFSLRAIKTVTNLNETIRAGELIERLMDLLESTTRLNLDHSWIEDFSPSNYNEIPEFKTAIYLKQRDVTGRSEERHSSKIISPSSSADRGIHLDERRKLENETFKLLCEVNCVECFERPRSILLVPCEHFVLCSHCYHKQNNYIKKCPLCQGFVTSYTNVYRS